MTTRMVPLSLPSPAHMTALLDCVEQAIVDLAGNAPSHANDEESFLLACGGMMVMARRARRAMILRRVASEDERVVDTTLVVQPGTAEIGDVREAVMTERRVEEANGQRASLIALPASNFP